MTSVTFSVCVIVVTFLCCDITCVCALFVAAIVCVIFVTFLGYDVTYACALFIVAGLRYFVTFLGSDVTNV